MCQMYLFAKSKQGDLSPCFLYYDQTLPYNSEETNMKYSMLPFFALILCFFACNGTKTDTSTPLSDCQECLNDGGTWQVDECTSNCALQDISCFRDTCPPACSEDCSGCFSESECNNAGCEWVWQEFDSTCQSAE